MPDESTTVKRNAALFDISQAALRARANGATEQQIANSAGCTIPDAVPRHSFRILIASSRANTTTPDLPISDTGQGELGDSVICYQPVDCFQ